MVWLGNLWVSDLHTPFMACICGLLWFTFHPGQSVQCPVGYCSSRFLCGFHRTDAPSPLQHFRGGLQYSACCLLWLGAPARFFVEKPHLRLTFAFCGSFYYWWLKNIYYCHHHCNHYYYVWQARGDQRSTLWGIALASFMWAPGTELTLLVLLSISPAEPSHRPHTHPAVYLNFPPHKHLVS